MVLGLKAKNRKNSVQLDYLIHIQEIKPWPPSQSLRTLRAVLLQWEHGDRSSGSTKQIVPSLGTGSGDGRIEFNESFRLPVTMLREFSARTGNGDAFQKNCIEFNLYESRRDKTLKGLLGTAAIDLADYAVVKEAIGISAPINCKRTYGNASQPILYLKIQSVEKSRMSSLSKDSLTGEASLDRNGVDSVSALMSEEYAEEADTASFTDDDVSSHSSLAVSSSAVESTGDSPLQNKESESEEMKTRAEQAEDSCAPALEQQLVKADDEQFTTSNSSSKGNSSRSSSIDITSDLAWITKKIGAHGNKFSSSPVMHEATETENSYMRSSSSAAVVPLNIGENVSDEGRNDDTLNRTEESNEVIISSSDSNVKGDESLDSGINGDDDDNATDPNNKGNYKSDFTNNGSAEIEKYKKSQENGNPREVMDKSGQCTEDEPTDSSSGFDLRTQDSLESDAFSVGRDLSAIQSNTQNVGKHNNKHVKSVRSSMESHRSNGLVRANPLTLGETQSCVEVFKSSERKDNKVHPKETRNIISDSKFKQLEQRIKRLETELREAAAIEVGLYAVVAEHGSSTNKVHAPARRLSRFYLHAGNAKPPRRGSAAKSAISGLVLVAKACGNDVPRLTYWLSNVIVLRAIISEPLGERQLPLSGTVTRQNGMGNQSKLPSPLKWHSLPSKGIGSNLHESSVDWDDPCTFQNALGKVEVWIFSRIIESIWWQTLIPHMQSGAANAIHKGMIISSHKTCHRTFGSFNEEQENFSLELWKEAFRDACERICPVRAEGHECGCLPLLSRLIMEQCVARLDVAMFNAILRESVDDIPTDPVSDPISDVKVLPIPVGKASFGAGAQLKNAIGNWSRWLTDLFGIDDDDDTNEDVKRTCESSDDESHGKDASLKSFNLLNALSDLMMLPKDMLLSRTIRKEVCPTFGSSLIRRVLNAFVPDEFCPEPVPKVVLEALNAEDSFDAEDSLVNFPCNAAPVDYLPPSAASVKGILGDAGSHYRLARNGSLSLTKSYTSDDELDEMASPLSSIVTDRIRDSPTTKAMWSSRENVSQNATRYQLLREVWKNSDFL